MQKYYIATRLTPQQMAQAAGRNLPRLNGKMTATLATVAMSKGIKKTQDRKPLTFYAVDADLYKELTHPSTATMIALKSSIDFRPLLSVDADLLGRKINEVNANYTRRMDRDTYRRYEHELQAAVEESVVKLQEDRKVERARYGNEQGIQVGDWVSAGLSYREYGFGRVVKITEHSYTYEVLAPVERVHRDSLGYLQSRLQGVTGWGNTWDGEIKIPYAGNEDYFRVVGKKTQRFTRRRIFKLDPTVMVYTNSWYTD